MLWPPEYTAEVVTLDGVNYNSPLDAPAGKPIFHEKCHDVRTNDGTECFEPEVPSENDRRVLKQ